MLSSTLLDNNFVNGSLLLLSSILIMVFSKLNKFENGDERDVFGRNILD